VTPDQGIRGLIVAVVSLVLFVMIAWFTVPIFKDGIKIVRAALGRVVAAVQDPTKDASDALKPIGIALTALVGIVFMLVLLAQLLPEEVTVRNIGTSILRWIGNFVLTGSPGGV
jgi:hypothetical protein